MHGEDANSIGIAATCSGVTVNADATRRAASQLTRFLKTIAEIALH